MQGTPALNMIIIDISGKKTKLGRYVKESQFTVYASGGVWRISGWFCSFVYIWQFNNCDMCLGGLVEFDWHNKFDWLLIEWSCEGKLKHQIFAHEMKWRREVCHQYAAENQIIFAVVSIQSHTAKIFFCHCFLCTFIILTESYRNLDQTSFCQLTSTWRWHGGQRQGRRQWRWRWRRWRWWGRACRAPWPQTSSRSLLRRRPRHPSACLWSPDGNVKQAFVVFVELKNDPDYPDLLEDGGELPVNPRAREALLIVGRVQRHPEEEENVQNHRTINVVNDIAI